MNKKYFLISVLAVIFFLAIRNYSQELSSPTETTQPIQQSSPTVTQPVQQSAQQMAEEVKRAAEKPKPQPAKPTPVKPKVRATTLAVLNFVPIGVSVITTTAVSDLLRTAMHNLGVFIVKEKPEMQQIFKQNDITEIPSCEDTASALKYGKMLKVDKVIYGTVDRLVDKVVLNVRVADMHMEILEFADRTSYNREEELDTAVDNFAVKLSSAIEKRQIELRTLAEVKKSTAGVESSTSTVKVRPKIREIIGKDGIPMVYVSSGEFVMGCSDKTGKINEQPAHKVMLNAFYIDKYEVSNAEYKAFVEATGRHYPLYCSSQYYRDNNLPVVGVTWNDAIAYATWVGERLPSEAEWEKASRGTDMRMYPWGNEWKVENNTYFANCRTDKDGYKYVAPVDSFEGGQSPYNCYNMSGNVWEWCYDWYSASYYRDSPSENPKGPTKGIFRIIRGGSWFNSYYTCRVTERSSYLPESATNWIGFRCVKTAR